MKTKPATYLCFDGTSLSCEVTNVREEIPPLGKKRRKVGDLIVPNTSGGYDTWDCVPMGDKRGNWELVQP